MDGRFPFGDGPGGRRTSQLNAAQMRAALGLPSADEAFYLQQAEHQRQQQLQQAEHQRQQQQQRQQQVAQQRQQRHQELTRDLQLRQLLLQEQLDQQLQEQQLQQIRAIGDQLHDFPDLQRHYQSLLLNEQLQRQQRSTSLTGATLSRTASAQQQQQAAYLREQQTKLREQAALRKYEEQLLRQQAEQQAFTNFRPNDMAQPSQAQSAATILAQSQQVHSQPSQNQTTARMLASVAAAQQQAQQQQEAVRRLSQNLASGSLPTSPTTMATEGVTSPTLEQASALLPGPAQAALKDDKSSYGVESERSDTPSYEQKRLVDGSDTGHSAEQSSTKKRKARSSSTSRKKKAPPTSTPQEPADSYGQPPRSPSPALSDRSSEKYVSYPHSHALETFAYAAELVEPAIARLGTVEDLLEAAKDCEKLDDAAMIMITKLSEVELSDSEQEDNCSVDGAQTPPKPAESITTPTFKSSLPSLPEEPLFDERSPIGDLANGGIDSEGNRDNNKEPNASAASLVNGDTKRKDKSSKKPPAILEVSYPVDTWWPSINGIRRERRNAGETSDEDDFVETAPVSGVFRANERKIRSRLSTSVEPGVLEKMNHCRIHRVRMSEKKPSKTPELVYCWQVTECYPNDLMVNCSRCGTWRHAACGGHYKSYSTRENTQKPFIAVCEQCHEEDKFLQDYPHAERRIERQRQEQLRRALATSSVMRHSSFSKHGGTYKWPLGSVSATHIGGHTRSVHARHDKAEKQWNDMATRLGRSHGYRQKERLRSRTKELERLLNSIEDAESFTDRHNMLLFLLRDTAKETPAGLENQTVNIFDPAEDNSASKIFNEDSEDEEKATGVVVGGRSEAGEGCETGSTAAAAAVIETCSRIGCEKKQRFDSHFCSDSCGLATLEMDLLRALQDSSDIHPSVLRL